VEVLELVVVALTDNETFEDRVAPVLGVCDTDTVDVFELVWLSDAIGVVEACADEDTDALGDSDSELRLLIDARGVVETLLLTDELADVEIELVSL